MTFEEIRQAIEGRFADWLHTPIHWDNIDGAMYTQAAIDNRIIDLALNDKWPGADQGAPADNQEIAAHEVSWIRLTILHGASTVASISNAPEVRRTGIISVQVFTPEHRGSGPAHRLADKVAELIQFYRSGHLETMASSVERVGKEEDWYNLLVSTPFRAGC